MCASIFLLTENLPKGRMREQKFKHYERKEFKDSFPSVTCTWNFLTDCDCWAATQLRHYLQHTGLSQSIPLSSKSFHDTKITTISNLDPWYSNLTQIWKRCICLMKSFQTFRFKSYIDRHTWQSHTQTDLTKIYYLPKDADGPIIPSNNYKCNGAWWTNFKPLNLHSLWGDTFLLNFWRTQVLFVGPLIPLFWTSGDVCPGFQNQVGSHFCVSSHLCDPQIHLWCNTCWLYRRQHGSQAFCVHELAPAPKTGYAWTGYAAGGKPLAVLFLGQFHKARANGGWKGTSFCFSYPGLGVVFFFHSWTKAPSYQHLVNTMPTQK